MDTAVTAIVVSFAEPAATRATVESLLSQQSLLEVIVVDNHPDAPFAEVLGTPPDRVRLAPPEGNVGYVRACNSAARMARGDWLWFLNPDAAAAPDCLARMLEAGAPDDVAIVGAQVLLPGGEQVNAGDNPIHLSGLCWSGRYGAPRERGAPREVAAVSGASLMIRRAVFDGLGGFEPSYFMYQDDTEICWRARLAGWRVLFAPEAVVEHDYVFDKGRGKWFWLERNRWWTVLGAYEARTLVLLAPLLLAVELGVVALAVRDGWWREKLRAWASIVRELPSLRRHRRAVQALRRVDDATLLDAMAARLDTPLMQAPLVARLGPALDRYKAVVTSAAGR